MAPFTKFKNRWYLLTTVYHANWTLAKISLSGYVAVGQIMVSCFFDVIAKGNNCCSRQLWQMQTNHGQNSPRSKNSSLFLCWKIHVFFHGFTRTLIFSFQICHFCISLQILDTWLWFFSFELCEWEFHFCEDLRILIWTSEKIRRCNTRIFLATLKKKGKLDRIKSAVLKLFYQKNPLTRYICCLSCMGEDLK